MEGAAAVEAHVSPPTLEEGKYALKTMRNNKTPGVDGKPAELLKTRNMRMATKRHGFINLIWSDETM